MWKIVNKIRNVKRRVFIVFILLVAAVIVAGRLSIKNTDKQVSSDLGNANSSMSDTNGSSINNQALSNGVMIDKEIDNKLLIENLDKVSDETISYVYQESPDNITVGSIFEGLFTDSGKPELLVIFKLLKVPHAGGLDCSVAAVYDRSTLNIITQNTFHYDECKFSVLTDDAQESFLLFVGSTTYQGYSQYALGLWKPGDTWEMIFPKDPAYMNNKKFELKKDGAVWVSRPVYDTSGDDTLADIMWLHEYNLEWNKAAHIFDEVIPSIYKDTNRIPNVDAVSVAPSGKYAISTVLSEYKVLVYDTEKNTLDSEFELPAQDYGFLWSPDSSKVCVTMVARIWISVSIIAVDSHKIIELPTIAEVIDTFKKENVIVDYVLNENRPDPYLAPVEWSPDSNELLIFYQWTDNKQNRQNGTFAFNVDTGVLSRITQNQAVQEGGNLPVERPEGFNW